MSDPVLSLHEGAAAAFNSQMLGLLSQVVRRKASIPFRPAFDPDFVPKVAINEEDISNFEWTSFDTLSQTTSRFRKIGDEEIGLDSAAYEGIRKLASNVQKCDGFRQRVHARSIEDFVFDTLVQWTAEGTSADFCQLLIEEFNKRVRKLTVLVPLSGILTQLRVRVGNVEFMPFTRQFFDYFVAQFKGKEDYGETMVPMVEHYRGRLQGHCAAVLTLTAEDEHAKEVALAETENALSILRAFEPCIVHPLVPSTLRPLGREFRSRSECIVTTEKQFLPVSANESNSKPLVLDRNMLEMMGKSGLGNLVRLYNKKPRSEFENDLLSSVFVYSHSSLQPTPEERLLFVFRALESLLIKDKQEPLQTNIADRMAFIVTTNPEERQSIASVVVRAYGLRSDYVHHNRADGTVELLSDFLCIVFRFFIVLLSSSEKYETRKDFFDEVARRKFA